MAEHHNELEQIRFYTRARRVRTMVGVLPGGRGLRLPFGPYSLIQVGGVFIALVVMWKTAWLWSSGSFIRDLGILGLVLAGVIFGLGKIPDGGRNPLSLVLGTLGLFRAPAHGYYRGRPVRVRAPHKARFRVSHRRAEFNGTDGPEPADHHRAGASKPPTPEPLPPGDQEHGLGQRTAVEKLLAAAVTGMNGRTRA